MQASLAFACVHTFVNTQSGDRYEFTGTSDVGRSRSHVIGKSTHFLQTENEWCLLMVSRARLYPMSRAVVGYRITSPCGFCSPARRSINWRVISSGTLTDTGKLLQTVGGLFRCSRVVTTQRQKGWHRLICFVDKSAIQPPSRTAYVVCVWERERGGGGGGGADRQTDRDKETDKQRENVGFEIRCCCCFVVFGGSLKFYPN